MPRRTASCAARTSRCPPWAYQVLRRYPDAGRRLLRRRMEQALPAGYPVEEHFTPTYDPWDQRLCAAADGDLFRVLGDGRASVVTASTRT